ncbi:MAG: hypothetical protein AMXMBFR48_11050 [Ignavibacteriales bacterium]
MNNIRDRFRVVFSVPRKDRIDDLAWHLMTRGYIVTQRKFGKYLSDPPKVAGYDVDLIGKKGKDYLIGLIVDSDDNFTKEFTEKVEILSGRKTKYTYRAVPLYLSVPADRLNELRKAISSVSDESRKNIRIHVYTSAQLPSLFSEENQRTKAFIN